jgi:hypothetical protein
VAEVVSSSRARTMAMSNRRFYRLWLVFIYRTESHRSIGYDLKKTEITAGIGSPSPIMAFGTPRPLLFLRRRGVPIAVMATSQYERKILNRIKAIK